MQIKIAERLRPFSHQSGTFCLVPYTTWEVQIFPTRLYFRNLVNYEEFELRLFFKGPIKDFTVQQDLEDGFIRVFGHSPEGYFEYRIEQEALKFKKLPQSGIVCGEDTVHKGDTFDLPLQAFPVEPSVERLSLGMHRSQDWDRIKRGNDLKEIFPAWLRLETLTPFENKQQLPNAGTLTLLNACRKAIEERNKNDLVFLFTQLFQTAFQGILAPRLQDELFLGIVPEIEVPQEISPLVILHEGAKLIRGLFFKEEGHQLSILPSLPPEFHSGRYIVSEELSFEWSKKIIKKIILKSKIDREIHLILQRPIQSYRMRTSLKERGRKIFKDKTIFFKQNQIIYLDRFEK